MICEHCKEEYSPTLEMWARIGLEGEEYRDTRAYHGRGCAKCHSTGFKGRQGIFELLHMSQEMKALVLQTSDANEIKRKAIEMV